MFGAVSSACVPIGNMGTKSHNLPFFLYKNHLDSWFDESAVLSTWYLGSKKGDYKKWVKFVLIMHMGRKSSCDALFVKILSIYVLGWKKANC